MGFGIENELTDLGLSLGGQVLQDLLSTDDMISKNNSSFIDDIIKSVDDENAKNQAEKIIVTQNKAEIANDLEMQTDLEVTEDKIYNQSHHVCPPPTTRLPVLHPQKRKFSINENSLRITPLKRVKYDVKCPEFRVRRL